MSFRISLCCKLLFERNFTQHNANAISLHTRTYIYIYVFIDVSLYIKCCIPHLSHTSRHAGYECVHALVRRHITPQNILECPRRDICIHSYYIYNFTRCQQQPTKTSTFGHIKVETKIECGVDLMEIWLKFVGLLESSNCEVLMPASAQHSHLNGMVIFDCTFNAFHRLYCESDRHSAMWQYFSWHLSECY